MKQLLAHDFLLARGGAEKLVVDFCLLFPGMELSVGFGQHDLSGEVRNRGIQLHELSRGYGARFKAARTLGTILSYMQAKPLLNAYDLVVYSGINALLAQGLQETGRKLYYCHTPPRYLYDLRDFYKSSHSGLYNFFLDQFIKLYKPRYELAVASMDLVVANSLNVQGRLKHYLGVDSIVVNPPVDVESYSYQISAGYYLSTSRLEPYKRIESVIEAFKAMPEKRLIVASGGGDSARLKALAKGNPNITFTGWLQFSELKSLVERCIATIYIPRDEDFGMSPVESMAAGKPVIGVNEGGVKETVIDLVTGCLVKPDELVQGVIDAVSCLDKNRAAEMRQECEKRAEEFSATVFKEKMENLFSSLLS